MRVNVGRAKTDLSKLLVRVEAGEDIEIARGWCPDRSSGTDRSSPGARRPIPRGTGIARWAGLDREDFEFTEEEIDQMLNQSA